MTANGQMILAFLKKNYGSEFSKQQIADALGLSLSAVIGTINNLQKREFTVITREETVEIEHGTETKKPKVKIVKYHTLTEAGLAYDPEEEARQKEIEKAAEKERKAAEKAAKKAAKAAKGDD